MPSIEERGCKQPSKRSGTSNDEWRRKRDYVMTDSHKKEFDDVQVPLSEFFEALLVP